MTKNIVLTPPDYARDIRHYEFDLSGSGFKYSVGDCLGIYAHNKKDKVEEFLADYGLDGNATLTLNDTQASEIASCVL